MGRWLVVAGLLLMAGLGLKPLAAAPVFKCTIDGSVTYQRMPCPTNEARGADPTIEQLNAERLRKQREAAKRAASAPASAAATPPAAAAVPSARSRSAETSPSPSTTSFRCDGRTTCTQMTSCAEAKYFLTHCPGVTMDGNRDGIPCERQWCKP